MNDKVGFAVAMMFMIVIFIPNITRTTNDRVVKESKIITLNKNQKGHIVYKLKKGRYKIRISPNVNIDSYIVGEGEEFNPTIYEDTAEYEIDTNKERESFKQEYNSKKNSKVKIEMVNLHLKCNIIL